MKKIISITLLFILSLQTYAQIYETSNFKRNELKVDVLYPLIVKTLKVEYEYFLSDISSFGVVGFYNLGDHEYQNFKTQVLATYRLYFGEEPVSGFFFEGNLGVTSGRYDEGAGIQIQIGTRQPIENPYTAFGVGFALGWKYVIPKSGVTLDLLCGAGRMLGKNNIGFYTRFGVTVGKRF
ncbi:MAG: hypothetical protein FWG79_04610 [Bacteroidales bacterium]|nr:hypothetical protein [Bacteroidales bacterium]